MMRRKKSSRMRGSMTHGWGAKKKHRGAGNRGGRGRAGSGKRGDAKKPSYWKERGGKYGFKRPTKKIRKIKCINLKDLEKNLNMFIRDNPDIENEGVFSIDLKKEGYDKLLGKGKVTKKFNISVDYASKSALEKIKKAGGTVTVKPKEEKKKEAKPKEAPKPKEEKKEEIKVKEEPEKEAETPPAKEEATEKEAPKQESKGD